MNSNIFSKTIRRTACLGLIAVLSLGCKPPEETVATNNGGNDGGRNLPAASVGGGGGGGTPVGNAGGGGGGQANARARGGGGGRDLPSASVGGGSGPGTAVPGPRNNSNDDNTASTVDDIVIKGAPLNGFFPQTEGFTKSGFGGGLLPQDQGVHRVSPPADSFVGTSGVIDLAPPPITETTNGMLTLAEQAFSQRKEVEAFKYLYAHLLIDENAKAEYPVKWYAAPEKGLPVGPLVAMRWGVGVVFNAPENFDGKPPVLGDPAPEPVETPSRGRGRGRGTGAGLGGGGAGLVGGPAGGGGGSAGDSPYRNLDTSHPEGFLLYYTGEYGDHLLTQLEAKRNDSSGYYGKIMTDIDVDYTQFETAGQAPAATPQRRRNPRRNGRRAKRWTWWPRRRRSSSRSWWQSE